MGKRPCDSSNALGQRHSGARSGIQVSRPEPRNYHVLWRRLSVHPYGCGCAKDGLPECFFAQKRLQGLAASGVADEERLRFMRHSPRGAASVSLWVEVRAGFLRKQARFSALSKDTSFSFAQSPIKQI